MKLYYFTLKVYFTHNNIICIIIKTFQHGSAGKRMALKDQQIPTRPCQTEKENKLVSRTENG